MKKILYILLAIIISHGILLAQPVNVGPNEDLSSVINSGTEGTEFILDGSEYTVNGSIFLKNGMKITGNGATLKPGTTGYYPLVTPSHAFVLKGVSNCLIENIKIQDFENAFVGSYTKEDGIYSGYGAGLYITGSTGIELNGVIVKGCSALQGGGLYVEESTLTIESSIIGDDYNGDYNKSNQAVHGDGGGIYALNSNITMTDTKIDSNVADKGYGGGIYMEGGTSRLTIEGMNGTIYNNTALNGGGIYLKNVGTVSITGVTITQNSATNAGGGIFNYNSNLTISESSINRNTAEYIGGGGVYNYSPDSNSSRIMELKNSSISSNGVKSGNGGGIYNDNASPVLTEMHFENNRIESGDGGGMYNINNSNSKLERVTFIYNNAFGAGKGICNIQSSPEITLGSIQGSGNIPPPLRSLTTRSGGIMEGPGAGIFNDLGSSPHISGVNESGSISYVEILQNKTLGDGGGIANYYNSNPVLTYVVLNNNISSSYGGGVSNSYSSPVFLNSEIRWNHVDGEGAFGGGISNAGNEAKPFYFNTLIDGNGVSDGNSDISTTGAGVQNFARTEPTFINSTIVRNDAHKYVFNELGGYYDPTPYSQNIYNAPVTDPNTKVKMFAYNTILYGDENDDVSTLSPDDFWNSFVKGLDLTAASGRDNLDGSLDKTDIFTDYDGGDFTLKTATPLKDKGQFAYYANPFNTPFNGQVIPIMMEDLAANNRIMDNEIELGAYEIPGLIPFMAVMSGGGIYCVGDDFAGPKIAVSGTNGGNWKVFYNNGQQDISLEGTGDAVLSVNPPASTTIFKMVSIQMGVESGVASGSAIYTISAGPSATISGGTTISSGSSANLTIHFAGTAPYRNIEYMEGSVLKTIAGPVNSDSYTFPVSPTVETTYTLVSFEDSTPGGCPPHINSSTTVGIENGGNPPINPPVDPSKPDPDGDPALKVYNVEICSDATAVEIPFDLLYTKAKVEYKILFSEAAKKAGFVDLTTYAVLPGSGKFVINVPVGISKGVYTGTIYIRATDGAKLIEKYSFTIEVMDIVRITKQPSGIANLCAGESFTLTVDAEGDGIAYQWYKDGQRISGATSDTYQGTFSKDKGGVYYVEVISYCNTENSTKVTVSGSPFSIQIKWDDVLYVDNMDNTYTTFQWYKDGQAISKYGNSIYYTDPDGFIGSYTVRAFKNDQSYDESCPVVFEQLTRSSSVAVYPNPVNRNSSLTVESDELGESFMGARIEVYDFAGRRVYTTQALSSQAVIPALRYAGNYVVKIQLVNGKIITKKIIVN